MNKVIQNFFLIFIPLYPFWAWFFYSFTKKPASVFLVIMLIPLTLYSLISKRIKVPAYLVFLILFTIYHLCSVFVNNLFPPGANIVYYLLSDTNIFACLVFIVIESTYFDESFINKMSRLIFVTVIITCIVSLIQIKYPLFFISTEVTGNIANVIYLEDQRNFSVWSWINLNSLGISFPFLIAILLSVYSSRKKAIPITIISGIIVSFLTRARYVMLSTIIVLSQLFFNSMIGIRKKVYALVLLFGILALLIGAASIYGFDIQQVIDKRILEKESGMGSANARITSLEVFLVKFPENPWFGVGPETRADVLRLLDGVAPIIHVGYLSYLYFYGLFGALLLFLSLFYLLIHAWKAGKKYAFWGSFYGLLSFCFANLTFVYFNVSEVGLILAVLYLKYYNDQETTELSEELIT